MQTSQYFSLIRRRNLVGAALPPLRTIIAISGTATRRDPSRYCGKKAQRETAMVIATQAMSFKSESARTTVSLRVGLGLLYAGG
jgi:hypothetical protein